MQVQSFNQPSFNGIKIASARARLNNHITDYDLYKITPRDVEFMDNLVQSIDLPALWPGLKNFEYFSWARALGGLFNTAKFDNFESLLIVQNDIPCGGINYKRQRDVVHVGYRVTWPIEKGKKAPFAGKILYLQLFKKAILEGIKSIKTTVGLNSPFNTLLKCRQLGFTSTGGDNFNELLVINREKILKTLENFSENIEIQPTPEEEQTDVDLSSILKSFLSNHGN